MCTIGHRAAGYDVCCSSSQFRNLRRKRRGYELSLSINHTIRRDWRCRLAGEDSEEEADCVHKLHYSQAAKLNGCHWMEGKVKPVET